MKSKETMRICIRNVTASMGNYKHEHILYKNRKRLVTDKEIV
jgi:hypothetical protein